MSRKCPRRIASFPAIALLAALSLAAVPRPAPAADGIVLNEVLARNGFSGLDDDGDPEDWAEILNRGPAEIDLAGYSLTDDPALPGKWLFPAIPVPPGGRLRVWLSGKNRFIPPSEAISAPGGIVGFRPSIIAEGDEWQYLLADPARQGPPAGWNLRDFDAAAAGFLPGRSGFGYSDDDDYTILPAGTTAIFIRKVLRIDDPGALVNLVLQVDFDDGFIAWLNGTRAAAEYAPAGDPNFQSLATVGHEAGTPIRYDLTPFLDRLVPGENVLAFAGLNVSSGSSDLSLAPELGTVPLILHTSFKLDGDGEYLGLFDPSGGAVDTVEIPPQTTDHSYGRFPDGGEVWSYLLTPTPEAPNLGRTSAGPFSDQVLFAPEPGKYPAPIDLELSVDPAGISEIRYTADGSVPTASSALYAGPIRLEGSTVFRAAGFIEGERSTAIASRSYFLGSSTLALPILSISMEPADYTKVHTDSWASGRGSERPAFLEIFDPDGSLARATGFGLRIHGGAGRDGGMDTKKSYKCYFRQSYGEGRLRYPIIPDTADVEFDKLVLRAGFNDAFRTNGAAAYLRDQVIRDLHRDMGGLAARGSWYDLFVNMRYRGLYNVTERMDEVFLESCTGLEEWDVMKTGNDVLAGDNLEWERLHNFMVGNDLSRDDLYEQAIELLDLENFTSYMILNTWAQNHDWPHNNWYAARPRTPDGRWIFLCWDAEFGLGLIPGGYSADSFEFTLSMGGYIRDAFASILASPRYRAYFAEEVDRHLFFALKPKNVLAHIDAIQKAIAPDIPEEAALTGNSSNQWLSNVATVRSFASGRGSVYRNFLLNSARFDFPAPPRVFACDQPTVVNAGGTIVRLRGVRFRSDTRVSFDGIPAAATKYGSNAGDPILDTTLPLDLSIGVLPVIAVEDPKTGESSEARGLLEVLPPVPEPLLIEPAEGNAAGGETVRISGDLLLEGATVTFGGRPAAEVRVAGDPPAIEAVTPPGEGEVEVLIANRIGGVDLPARAALRFTYRVRGPRFLRGDANGDRTIDISDPIGILSFLFTGGTGPGCRAAADVDASEEVDLSDGIFALAFLFLSGRPPPPPHPDCGLDPSPGALGCEAPPDCP